LRLFNFRSVRHYDEEGFAKQVIEDLFTLATCIYFLAFSINPIIKANSYAKVQETVNMLKTG
ncbi:hypothetical protein BCR34DRAFT_495590, partial [Clohesyomyces aquaticus]